MSGISPDYELLTPLPSLCAQVRFSGPYQGEMIVWNLRLYTVDHYFQNRPALSEDDGPETPSQFMFIEEGAGANDIMVAVDVSCIDEPTLKKVLIMIRNYKRLRPGWHAWGTGKAT